MAFYKNKEDFVCKNCGHFVTGNGFTNHCPKCLFSLHIDNDPGDRANNCLGMMRPIDFIFKKGSIQSVVHKCQICGLEKKNKVSEEDSREKILKIMQEISEKKSKK